MEKKNVLVGVANKNEQSMKVEDIKGWDVEKISYVGTTTYFKRTEDEGFYSMDRQDFNAIFTDKVKG